MGLAQQKPRHRLQIVLDAVVDFFHQGFALLHRMGQPCFLLLFGIGDVFGDAHDATYPSGAIAYRESPRADPAHRAVRPHDAELGDLLA